jgi:hypothetical protein
MPRPALIESLLDRPDCKGKSCTGKSRVGPWLVSPQEGVRGARARLNVDRGHAAVFDASHAHHIRHGQYG